MRSITNPKIIQAVNRLNYDFREFEILHFLNHVARFRQRDIECRGMEFEETLFGLWLPGEKTDYIAYNVRSYRVHRIHSILHEVGHMLLNHLPVNLEQIVSQNVTTWFEDIARQEPHAPPQVLLRTVSQAYMRSNPQEVEAEDFGIYVQEQIIQANRFKYLFHAPANIEVMRALANGLGFGE